MPVNASLLLPLVAVLAPGPPDLSRAAGFTPGPFALGLRPERLHDTSRSWPSASDPAGAKGRPLQITLWYPAHAGDEPGASIEEMVLADATFGSEAAGRSAASGSALAAARTAFDAGAGRALTDAEWQRVLETRSVARLGVQPLPGRRALVLLESGLGSRSFTLAPVAELLASHGYVVAALATEGASEKDRLGFDLVGVRAQVDDMKLALSHLRDRPEVDPRRVGLVSWSVGGVSQAILRLEAPKDFRAAVSLDSGSGYAYGAEILRQAGGADPARLTVPFLHFDVGRANTPVPKDDGFLRAHPVGSARRVLLEDMRHADFTLSHGAGCVVATGQAPPAAARALSQTLLAFLDAHLPTRRTEER